VKKKTERLREESLRGAGRKRALAGTHPEGRRNLRGFQIEAGSSEKEAKRLQGELTQSEENAARLQEEHEAKRDESPARPTNRRDFKRR
jgi:hypothetical protein